MSWPSFYGYKYTPIGLRQRELKDEMGGSKTFATTIHLPQGGHLLDIERRFNNDGSVSKTETSCLPHSFPEFEHNPKSAVPRNLQPAKIEPPRPLSDLDRQADEIIANFRARHAGGLERMRKNANDFFNDEF